MKARGRTPFGNIERARSPMATVQRRDLGAEIESLYRRITAERERERGRERERMKERKRLSESAPFSPLKNVLTALRL